MPPPAISDPWLASRKFAIVIDAGSSGSRLQIYSWRDAKVVRQAANSAQELHALPAVEKGTKGADDWQIKAEPGISTFGANPGGVAAYLAPLIAHAKDQIPPSLHKQTPIFLLATAGMRLLPESQQHAVLQSACEYIFLNSKFTFDGGNTVGSRCGRSIRIISGEEEGLFGWLAVNYLMNGFAPTHSDHERPTTYGFLDMGGASTQIAFEPSPDGKDKALTPDEHLADVRLRLLNGEEIRHQVFVTTWLGFGTNQARSRYLKQAVEQWLTKHHHPTSSADNHDATHPTTSTISSITLHDPCLPKNLQLHTTYHDVPYTPDATDGDVIPVQVEGTGSFTDCLAKTSPLLNKSAPCAREPCLFGGVHVPNIDFNHHRFIGISEYWYSSQHVFGLGGAFDFEKYEAAAEAFCGAEWNAILDKHLRTGNATTHTGALVEKSRLELQCFKAAWIVNVLGQGMGIPRTSSGWKNAEGDGEETVDATKAHQLGLDTDKGIPNAIFQSIDTIRGTAISWTLGKMVLEASKDIPAPRGQGGTNPISDPLGPPLAPAPPKTGWSLEGIEQRLPSPLRRESLGFSAVLLAFYVVVAVVLFSVASRMRLLQWRTSFRRWRRAPIKRDFEVLANESGVTAGFSDSSRPPSPATTASAQVQKLFSTLSRLLPGASRPSPALGTPRRTGALTPVGGLTISTGRPLPKYAYTMPSPASPSWTAVQTRDSDDDPPPPSGLNPNGLTVLSLSRNSSQINLTRTLPTPRNVSGFFTPGASQSGFRSPSSFADDV